jgi:glycosyltransferase involved in cell wall biosynthesis
MARVSVIVPTYRRERFLNLAIASLLAQTLADWEAVIVDGTPGGSMLEHADPRLRYFRESEHGVSGLAQARNFGIAQSDSKYIAYLDDDEYYYPTKLEIMLNFLEHEATGCEFAYHDVIVAAVEWVEGRLQHVGVPRRHWHPDGDPNEAIRTAFFIAGLQVVHTRNVFEKAGGFREERLRGVFQGRYRSRLLRYDEDADLFRRMAGHTRLERVPLQLGEYRVHGSNVNGWGIDYEEVLRKRRLVKDEY